MPDIPYVVHERQSWEKQARARANQFESTEAREIAQRALSEAQRARDLLEGFQAVIGQGCVEWEARQVAEERWDAERVKFDLTHAEVVWNRKQLRLYLSLWRDQAKEDTVSVKEARWRKEM